MDNSRPAVSVIIPMYNRERFVERAVRSVLRQTYSDFELIVVDDASTDSTDKLMVTFQNLDKRVRYFRHQSNHGAQAARNTGIKEACGEFIALLDSDNEWLPQKLELQMGIFKNSGDTCGVVYSGFRWEYADGSPSQDKLPCFRGNIYKDSLREWIADTSTMVVRKDLIVRAGSCDEKIRAYQEWDLCIRLAKYAEFDFVAEPLVIYHVNSHIPTISSDLLNSANGYMDIVTTFRNEILEELGRAVLSKHLLGAAHRYINASDYKSALVLLEGLIRNNPFYWKPLVYWVLCRFSPEKFSKLASFKRRLRPLNNKQ
jgi:glycosyltransferase involved in cell wall biosynthesis